MRKPLSAILREGTQKPVTKEAVRRLQAERPTLNTEVHYTIGGSVETTVHANENAEREAAITHGARRLAQASANVREGFTAAKPEARTEYIRIQRQAARTHPGRNVSRIKGPSR